jgi:signal transduction histidine kinase
MANPGTAASPESPDSLIRLRRMTLWLVASFAAIMLAAGTYHLATQYQESVASAFRTARATVLTVDSHAARTFGETAKVLEGIADVYRTQAAAGAVNERSLHETMNAKLADMPYVATFVIANPDGYAQAAARVYPFDKTVNIFALAPVKPAADSPDTFVGPLYHGGPDAPRWFLPMVTQVKDADGRVLAVIVAVMRPQYFANFYNTLDVGTHGRVALWRSDGYLIAATSTEPAATGDFDPEMKDYVRTLESRSGDRLLAYELRDAAMSEVHAVGPVTGVPLISSVFLSGEDYLAPWRATRNRILAGMGGIMVVMIGLAVIILKQLQVMRENEEALRYAKAAAEEASEAKSRFLAHMSHEFRTPLNAIMGFADIIKSRVMGDTIAPVYTTYAGHIHKSGEHLLNIVNDILDMAKIESGAQSLQRQPMDMAAIVSGAMAVVEGLSRQRNVDVRVTVGQDLPQVLGDERVVRQVLINLLSNATKFSAPGTTVTVQAAITHHGRLDLAVIDRGPGIEPTILKRIGEPFLQGNPALSRRGQGTGLGLSICKHYMDLLGGELVLESTLGAGTTAIMRFPPQLLIRPAAVA